jgi:hypothetical protein
VIIPLSLFKSNGTHLTSIIFVVFFAWWNFNTLTYFATL